MEAKLLSAIAHSGGTCQDWARVGIFVSIYFVALANEGTISGIYLDSVGGYALPLLGNWDFI